MIPRTTYRLQLHRGFPFAAARELVPYLYDLGISHLYTSPITTARSGSLHGYDVVDPTRVNPELGGEQGLRNLVAELRRHEMGLVIDIVPNHMGIVGGENAWWNDVLTHGRDSRFAGFFDIDWTGKLVLPFLGEPLDDAISHGALELRRSERGTELWAHGSHRFPLRPEDRTVSLDNDIAALLERQHYKLCWWRRANDELNWRRFFTVTELASLNVQNPEVFEATHALVFRLRDEGLIDGVRVDHIDGLADPATYCRKLRDRLGQDCYILVEKILAASESLPPEWPVDGTTGYDFMEQVSALLHNPTGEEPLTELWREFSGRSGEFRPEELQARKDMLSWEFEAQLSACVTAFARLARSDADAEPLTEAMLRRALQVLLWCFPAYRTYGTGCSAPDTDRPMREVAHERARALAPPGEISVVEQVLGWLAGHGGGDRTLQADAVRRFQQLSAPIAAKAVEDTAFYRFGRLLSRNDVGHDPSRWFLSPEQFGVACAQRAKTHPHAMLATATHDHKRGEDVRARLATLSDVPQEWCRRVRHWERLTSAEASGVEPADRYMLYQMLFGAWPDDLDGTDASQMRRFADRIGAWQQKSLREAKLRSSWTEPALPYEETCQGWTSTLLDARRSAAFLEDVCDLVRVTRNAARANSLVQVALKCTLPGVPDFYQGSEMPDLSLVDPDNRRPVDYTLRRSIFDQLESADPKFVMIRKVLQMRRQAPALFHDGAFVPAVVQGRRSQHIFAFARRHAGDVLKVAVALRCGAALSGTRVTPNTEWWGNTAIAFSNDHEPAEMASILFRKEMASVRLTTAD